MSPVTRAFLRRCAWALSALLGGLGVFCVWASLHGPFAVEAALFLGLASAIVWALPKS